MEIACLDMEGVLTPEIWIHFAKKTGIEELNATTRQIPDYDSLMKFRMGIMKKNNLKLKDIQEVVKTLPVLDGAVDFINWLRERFQVVILSDTFYEFTQPFMKQLGYPMLLCHTLKVENDNIMDYKLRQDNPKRQAIVAFKSLYYRTIACGDSYNDVQMFKEADAAFFLNSPDFIANQFPQYPSVHSYEDLKKEFIKSSIRNIKI